MVTIMQLLSLHLIDLNSLRMIGVKDINYNPITDTQVIIGTNGSGKTTLCANANPLPPSKPDFGPNGYKQTVWEHEGEIYTLTFNAKGGAHSFIINDGEELNKASTSHVQKDLVEKYLGYTPFIHSVFLGEVSFHSLKPTQRKDILMRLCPTDLSYIDDLFNKTKVRLRDTVAVEKHLVAKASDALKVLESIEISETDLEQHKQMEDQIEQLIQFRVEGDSVEVLQNRISTIESQMTNLTSNWFKSKDYLYVDDQVTDYNSLCDILPVLRNQLNNIPMQKQKLINKVTELRGKTFELLDGVTSVEQMQENIDQLELQVKEPIYKPRWLKDLNVPEVNPKTLLELSGNIHQTSTRFEFNRHFSQEECLGFIDHHTKLKKDLMSYQNQENSLESKLQHYQNEIDSLLTCPQCDHKFSTTGKKPEDLYNETRGRLKACRDAIAKTNNELVDASAKADKAQAYKQAMESIITPFRNYNCENILPFISPDGFKGIISNLRDTVECLIQISEYRSAVDDRSQLEKELSNTKKSLADYNAYGFDLPTAILDVEAELDGLILVEQDILTKLNKYKKMHMTYKRTESELEEVEKLQLELFDRMRQLTDAEVSAEASKLRSKLISKLSVITNAISKKRMVQRDYDNIKDDLDVVRKRKPALEALMKSLSTDKGVMADVLFSFTNSYIEGMNDVIRAVWTDDVHIGECNMDNGKLDYKFPLMLNDCPGKDISMTSKGQGEIIDLAFMMMMRSYLRMEEYPLFLDEIGPGFDQKHRTRLVDYIKKVIANKQCSQVFMISHYASVHGGLSNVEVVVTDERNVILPKVYNENYKVKRG